MKDAQGIQQALADQYKFERILGQGGMGVVYLARDLMLERSVAVKVLGGNDAEDGAQRERFLREARTAAQLAHPNIVPIYMADEAAGHVFFVMGYVEGESLGERLAARGPLPVDAVIGHLREVCWALAYAHARGVVHRDIKPENIMIDRATGRAIVTDFGIAHSVHETRLTMDGGVMGTAHYMSPEQVQGMELDGRSDLYALGVVGFHALSGKLPFDGPTSSAVLVHHVSKPAPRLREVAPHVPAPVAEVIDRCLSKTPEDRFESGEALAEALGAALTASEREPDTDPASASVVSEDQALLIWRRAAQLQAEAAHRLEERARLQASSTPSPTPSGGYRMRDVESAAVEAGISKHFVALARAELTSTPFVRRPQELSSFEERAARRWFGTTQQSLSVSRVIDAPPRRVLQAVGRALQQLPFGLALQRPEGPHPLDGGVLVFDIPAMISGEYAWKMIRYGLMARQFRLGLRPVPNDPMRTEVTVHLDVRQGLRVNLRLSAGFSAAFGGVGGLAGAGFAVKALALTGGLVALPALGTAVLVAGATVPVLAWSYRYGLRKAAEELEAAVSAIEQDIRSESLFGVPVTRDRPLRVEDLAG